MIPMSSLKPIEKRGFEDLFGMSSGYVLDFSNDRFAEFFRDTLRIDIYAPKYSGYGDSKAKRLRAFWDTEPDALVGQALSELLEVWAYGKEGAASADPIFQRCRETAGRLAGRPIKKPDTEENFLDRKIELPSLTRLSLDSVVTSILEYRLREIEVGLQNKVPLSVILLCGSVLEGVLLGTALQRPAEFNRSTSSPKDQAGKIKAFHEWSLAQLIDVACDLNLLQVDVKKFSHALRDFRNYIHPYQQMASGFAPDMHTATICFQVLKAALADLGKMR